MRIGIDIDGCINNQEDFVIDYGTKFIEEHSLPYKIEHFEKLNSDDVFGWDEKTALQFWEENRSKLAKKNIRPFCKEVINKLRKKGYEIYIITARVNGDIWWNLKDRNKVDKVTRRFLKNHGIKYDKLIFSRDKLKDIKNYQINIMIEDDKNNIERISKEIPVYIFNSRENSDFNPENTIRVYSWYDIYNRLSDFKKREDNEIKERTLHLHPTYFELIKSGEKTLEGRLYKGEKKEFKKGDIITFYKEPENKETIRTLILENFVFKNFEEMAEKLSKKDLGFDKFSKEEMINVYRKIYKKEDEEKYGVVVFKIKLIEK